jgi:RNA polymerase sigma-70 factor (ECF subfamily)
MTEDQLLRKAGRGDETAFLLLYERHRAGLFRFLYRMLGSAELAEDLTHDCFLSLIRQPERFDPKRATLRTYLYAAARNLAFKHFRQTGHEIVLDDLEEELPMPSRREPLQELLEEELVSKVRQAVAQLPPLQREALILFEYEGLSLAELAAVVETDVGTVKARLHRGRAGLRRSLGPYLKSSLLLTSVEVC